MAHFYIKARQNNSRVQLIQSGTTSTVSLEYSYDESNWSIWYKDTTLSSGQTLYLRGDNPDGYYTNPDNWNRFTATGEIEIGGDIRSLVDVTMASSIVPCSSCFISLFRDCTSLVSVSSSLLSGFTTLANNCYWTMFYGCTSLTSAPALPATTLTTRCYLGMFSNCTSLTTAPELPATTLTEWCYYSMLQGCTSLTTAPVLPATTLANYCYYRMFSGCTSLNYIKCLATDMPELNDCTTDWVYNVAPTGTFVKSADMSGWTTGVDGIPTGWTIRNDGVSAEVTFTAKQANSTIGLSQISSNQTLEYSIDGITWTNMTTGTTITLANSGDSVYVRGMLSGNNNYDNYTNFTMSGNVKVTGNINYLWNKNNPDAALKNFCGYALFSGCTALSDVSELELPATTLEQRCYRYMFQGCTSLTTAPALPATTLAWACYFGMFWGCTSLTTAPELPATTLATECYRSMFWGCTSLTTAPELPATTLAENCYYTMFHGCTSLTTAPELPATTLADSCYSQMFWGCTNLNYIKCLATNISANGCTGNWVKGVSATGTFYKNAAMNDWTIDSNDGVPIGWTVIDYTGTTMSIDFKLSGGTEWFPIEYIDKTSTSPSGGTVSFFVRYTHNTLGVTYGFLETTPTEQYWTVSQVAVSTGSTYDIVTYRLNYDAFRGDTTKEVNLSFYEIEDGTTIVNSGLTIEQSPYYGTTGISADVTTITGISWESPSYENIYLSYSGVNLDSVVASAISNPDMFEDIDWYDSSKTRLMVKCDENPVTVTRTGQVRVQAQSVAHEPMSVTITFTQEARPEGDIAVNPQTIHFQQDADGSSDKQSVYVSYTGFTSIGNVTATTDADWIEIEWRDDEVKNELYITPSENTGSSRQTIIIIAGTDDYDNIITAYVVVKQEGVNINPIWRDLYYTGATDTFDYIIVNEDTLETIYQGRAYVQPNSTNVKVNVSKIVQGYLNNEITDGNVLLNALYDDFNNQAVVDFGLYPVTGTTTGERIEKYTYYYDWSYNALDGNYVLTTPINGHATTTMRRMYTNISLEFDGYRNRANDSTLYDLSYCGDYALYYLQRNGGWASFLIEGNAKKTDSYEKYSYNMSFDNTTAEFEESTYHNQITSNWEMHTGWLTDEQADNLAFNLLASNRVFLHDLKKDKIIPVIISNSDAEYKTFKNNSRQMVNYTITLTESQKKQLL